MRTSSPQTGIAIAALMGLFVHCASNIKGNGEYDVDGGSTPSIVIDASPALVIDAGIPDAATPDAIVPDAQSTCVEGDVQAEDGATCYMLFHQLLTWPQAQQACENLGGNLVVVDSAAEQAIVGALAGNYSGNPDVLMGGSDAAAEGTWTWVTGAIFASYTHWRANEPNNGGGNEDCTIIEGDNGNREWDDRPCTTAFPYMCER